MAGITVETVIAAVAAIAGGFDFWAGYTYSDSISRRRLDL
jgi:hypothetical protein